MFVFAVLVCFSLLQFSVYCHGEGDEFTNIVNLTPETFDGKTGEFKITYNLFYADWCGHCKKLMPVYNEFCGELHKSDSGVLCSRLNCNEHKGYCEKFDVKGYPSLQRFSNKRSCSFSGERDIENLRKWHEQSLELVHEVTDSKKLEKHVGKSGEPLVVAFFKKPGSDLENHLVTSTCGGSPIKISLVRDSVIASKFGIPNSDGVYVVRGGKLDKKFEGKVENSDEIGRFLFLAGSDILPEYSMKNSQHIFSPLFNSYLAVIFDPKNKKTTEILKSVESVALERSGEVRFFKADVSQPDSNNVVEYFKIKEFPAICFYENEGNRFYHFDHKEINQANIVDFLDRCLAGKVEPYRAMQPVPDDWESGPVKQLVVGNFEEAKSRGKNVFVKFYAPWCGHCKSMKPAWIALGEHFKNDKSVMIAEMDVTQNDMPELNIQGFPTLKVFRPDGQILDYNGGRSFEELRDYVLNGFTVSKTPETPHEEL